MRRFMVKRGKGALDAGLRRQLQFPYGSYQRSGRRGRRASAEASGEVPFGVVTQPRRELFLHGNAPGSSRSHRRQDGVQGTGAALGEAAVSEPRSDLGTELGHTL